MDGWGRSKVLSKFVRWVVGSIHHGGPIELFLVPTSAPRLVYIPNAMVCAILSVEVFHIKEPLLLIADTSHLWAVKPLQRMDIVYS